MEKGLSGRRRVRSLRNAWGRLVSFQNLLLAARRAQRGKRFVPATAAFNFNLEGELLRLQRELVEGSYRPGPYRTFSIREPKERLISAAPYRDRVVHHALCNVMEPFFDRGFIEDSYACRRGKGTHAAVDRFQHHLRRYRYVLKCDVRKFFPSVDHGILLARLGRRVADRNVFRLARLIVENSNPQEEAAFYFPGDDLFTPGERRRGLPIGNLTSQFFANVYFDSFDHFVCQALRPGGYVRYSDDFALFADDKRFLRECLAACREHLAGLRLLLHPHKCQVFPAAQGAPFLGYRLLPGRRRLDPGNGWRMARRLRRMRRDYACGLLNIQDVRASLRAWIGHAQHAETMGLRRRLFREAVFARGCLPKRSGACAARRGLEQQPEELPLGQPQQQRPDQPQQQHRVSGCVVGRSALYGQSPASAEASAGACGERAQGGVPRRAGEAFRPAK